MQKVLFRSAEKEILQLRFVLLGDLNLNKFKGRTFGANNKI